MAEATKFERLVRKADDAGKIRKYSVNPDVVALRVERVMSAVTILMWVGVVLGLGFTVTNVAKFVGGLTGWLVSPAINAPLIALLIAGSIMARYGVVANWKVQAGKFLLLSFEYGLNTWLYWEAQDASEIFKHSVPIVIVVFCAEAVTDLRMKMAECVAAAYKFASENNDAPELPVIEEEKIVEPAPVAFIAEPVVEEETIVEEAANTEHYRPAGGKRAAQLAEDIAAMKAEFGDGVAFLMLSDTERMKAVKGLFSKGEQKCGNSRAIRLAGEFGKIVESELRSDVG